MCRAGLSTRLLPKAFLLRMRSAPRLSSCGSALTVALVRERQTQQDRSPKQLSSHPNHVRSRQAKLRHAVEDVACEPSLSDLRLGVTRMQPIAKHALVAHDRLCDCVESAIAAALNEWRLVFELVADPIA